MDQRRGQGRKQRWIGGDGGKGGEASDDGGGGSGGSACGSDPLGQEPPVGRGGASRLGEVVLGELKAVVVESVVSGAQHGCSIFFLDGIAVQLVVAALKVIGAQH